MFGSELILSMLPKFIRYNILSLGENVIAFNCYVFTFLFELFVNDAFVFPINR